MAKVLSDIDTLLESIKVLTGLTQEQIAQRIGYTRPYMSQAKKSGSEKLFNLLRREFAKELEHHIQIPEAPYSVKRGNQLNIPGPGGQGILYVPIAAQATYSRAFSDPGYLDQLERVHWPGFPYQGEHYRIFEVSDTDMDPTFREGAFLVTEYVAPAFWEGIADFYVYVLVTDDQVLLKRVYKKSPEEWVLISDNAEFHPQTVFPANHLKELWLVKRKMEWEVVLPKKFDISV
ncbi:S24 family peptidase [Paraflavisolibacter sp. H34]|uniref:S24 family peptidase n=1 Tax=Huijunlia imazamoxiresistens TaxID=3127457 RepID=UPI0030193DF4